MPERRKADRPGAPDRRSFPRPPLWLNLTVLVLALVSVGLARAHRGSIDRRFTEAIVGQEASPAEISRIRAELAELELTREQLKQELNSRLEYVESLESSEFYLAVDTSKKRLLFHYGDAIAREAPVTVGEPGSFKSPGGDEWTFVPLKGAFLVRAKEEGAPWEVPGWVYASNGQPVPSTPETVQDGLGKYVIHLPNGYVIHSPPPPSSPLRTAKPGSFMVAEEDLRAMWPRINDKTRVFIF